MQDLERLIEQTVNYLRANNVLAGNPIFENFATDFVCVDPRGEWEEYNMVYPYWQNVEVDIHESGFKSIDSQLNVVNLNDMQDKALEIIPDSSNTVIVEVGSRYGVKGAGYLAAHKPNTEVILISKTWEESVPPKYLFMESEYYKHRLTFKRGEEFLDDSDIERKTNKLYKANGINNVTFFGHELRNGEIPEFLHKFKGKDIYLFGQKAPVTLPFIAGRLYNDLNAKYLCVSLTAQEKIHSDAFVWNVVKRNLELDDNELKGFVNSAFDQKAAKIKDSMSDKYDYRKPAEERIGVMIKMGMALSLAKEVNGTVLRGINLQNAKNYNQIDHYVEAVR